MVVAVFKAVEQTGEVSFWKGGRGGGFHLIFYRLVGEGFSAGVTKLVLPQKAMLLKLQREVTICGPQREEKGMRKSGQTGMSQHCPTMVPFSCFLGSKGKQTCFYFHNV